MPAALTTRSIDPSPSGRARPAVAIVAIAALLGSVRSRSVDAADAPTRTTVVVSAAGDGQAKTITEGIKKAGKGGVVRVKAGTYAEPLVLSEPIEIVGEAGDPGAKPPASARPGAAASGLADPLVTVEFDNESVVTTSAAGVVIRGVRLRTVAKENAFVKSAVSVEGGDLTLDGCTIDAAAGAALVAKGAGVKVSLQRSSVHGGPVGGIVVSEGAALTLSGCELSGADRGLVDASGASTTVAMTSCTLRDAKEIGIVVDDGASLTFDDGRIEHGKSTQVRCFRGSKAALRGVTLANSGEHAALAYEGGLLTLERCEVAEPKRSGVIGRKAGSTVTMRKCEIHDCGETGSYVETGATLLLEDSTIRGCGVVGVEVRESSTADVRRTKVADSKKGAGLTLHHDATMRVEACETWGNRNGAIYVFESGTLSVKGGLLRDGAGYGVYVDSKSHGTLEGVEVKGHEDGGLGAWDSAVLDAKKVKVHDNKGPGAYFSDYATGTIEDSEFTSNGESGVVSSKAAAPVVRGCKLRKNKQYGVAALADGRGTFERCDLVDNVKGTWWLAPTATLNRTDNRPNK